MLEAWVVFYTFIGLSALIGMALMCVAADVCSYVSGGWQQYTLTDNEWHRLQLHEQTLMKSGRVSPGE